MAKRFSQLATLRPSAVPSLLEATSALTPLELNSLATPVGALAVSAPEFRIDVFERLRAFLGITHVENVPTLPKAQRYSALSRNNEELNVELPYGVPRHVRAGMLKLLLRANRRDNLLELKGDAWEFVDDKSWVDVTDRRRVFRIGRLQILS